MFKQINWKTVFYVSCWVVCLSGLVLLMSFIESKKSAATCKDVKILIPGTQNFIERQEIDRILLLQAGKLIGRDLRNINIQRIEAILKANPFIEFAKVYADMDGVINIRIRQREPLLHVFNMQDRDFYIDTKGYKIPSSDNFTANVLVANGLIAENYTGRVDTIKNKVAKDLFSVASFIAQDTLWSNQIEQLYVNPQSEIELVPRVGNQKIILGNADSLDTKFKNLYVFYKKALPKVGWDTYKTINIKYTNQIVCERNTIDSTKLKPVPVSAASVQTMGDSFNNIQDTSKH